MQSIGIDLGTTYSCVFSRAQGAERLLAAADGGDLTPSVVYFDPDGSVLVGTEAKSYVASDPDNVVVGIKRQMGKEFQLEYGGRTLTPEGISALILKRLAKDAADALGCRAEELQAVITVPAYFGVAEKEATHAAAKIAGLHCLELLAEPVAAAYAYGAHTESASTSLVFDLGGGTFDVAIIGFDHGSPRIWAVDGETQLGGLDWDLRLADLLWEQVEAQTGNDDFRDDDGFVGALNSAAEQVKRQLSQSDSAPKTIRHGKHKFALSVLRTDFETATRDLVLQCRRSVERVCGSATALGAPPISRVLLVGGSTRMPMIRVFLSDLLKVPVEIADPDKAVARGAAVLAEQLTVSPMLGGITVLAASPRITPVLPRALGVYVHSSAEPWRPDPYVRNALTANTQLPIVAHQVSVATILDNQDKARIQLYEQGGALVSERPEDNRLVFDCEVSDIPRANGGSEIRLLVSIGIDGRITAEARSYKNKLLPMEAFIQGVLDDNEVAKQSQAVAGFMLAD